MNDKLRELIQLDEELGAYDDPGIQAVWWVNEETYDHVTLLDLWRAGAPVWLGEQFNSAHGRPGRGRLWVAQEIATRESIKPWPTTHPNGVICEQRAGIVITWEVAHDVLIACRAAKYQPFITDNRLEIRPISIA